MQRTPMDFEDQADTLEFLCQLVDQVDRGDVCAVALTVQLADGDQVVFFRKGVHADPLRQMGALFVQALDIAPFVLDQLPD